MIKPKLFQVFDDGTKVYKDEVYEKMTEIVDGGVTNEFTILLETISDELMKAVAYETAFDTASIRSRLEDFAATCAEIIAEDKRDNIYSVQDNYSVDK